jgi:4-hydroxythreonine-4-phosphate dehydrogenase
MHLALTAGDPRGIGIEIILKALAQEAIIALGVDFTIFANRDLVEQTYRQLLPLVDVPLAHPNHLHIWDCGAVPDPGTASFTYLDRAIAATLAGQFAGIVTAPIAKSAWQRAGYNFPGQTELLAQRAGVTDYGMLFVARSPFTQWQMRVLLATVHIPLSQVCTALSPEVITQKLNLLCRTLTEDFGETTGTIAIAGINPHSGEGGHLGTEERDWLMPTLQQWQNPHFRVTAPIPPDSLWIKAAQAWHNPQSGHLGHCAYLAMYHDQGLIPVKMLAFDQAVNTTIGLPFVRTSPDHGTAFDIAGKGIADSRSFQSAIKLAHELVTTRQARTGHRR